MVKYFLRLKNSHLEQAHAEAYPVRRGIFLQGAKSVTPAAPGIHSLTPPCSGIRSIARIGIPTGEGQETCQPEKNQTVNSIQGERVSSLKTACQHARGRAKGLRRQHYDRFRHLLKMSKGRSVEKTTPYKVLSIQKYEIV